MSYGVSITVRFGKLSSIVVPKKTKKEMNKTTTMVK